MGRLEDQDWILDAVRGGKRAAIARGYPDVLSGQTCDRTLSVVVWKCCWQEVLGMLSPQELDWEQVVEL
jgi:hypothetical protein